MIGDGIGSDLAAARAVGARCILMLTGVATRAQVDALSTDEQPTAVAADAAELAAALLRFERGA
jgi:ribonucleotide monophosphatase NagD (HAD superfamily)